MYYDDEESSGLGFDPGLLLLPTALVGSVASFLQQKKAGEAAVKIAKIEAKTAKTAQEAAIAAQAAASKAQREASIAREKTIVMAAVVGGAALIGIMIIRSALSKKKR